MQATSAAFTREEVMAWARDLYARSVDRKDAAGFAAAFTPQAWLRFGNAPRIEGREAIREAIAQFYTAFNTLSHTSKGEFLDGDTLILEAEVTYVRHDAQQVTVPAVTIFRLAGAAHTRIRCRVARRPSRGAVRGALPPRDRRQAAGANSGVRST